MCLNPYFRNFSRLDELGYAHSYSLPLPCGRCEYCRYKQARTWAFRLCIEKENWQYAYFVTLTYAPEHLPDKGELKPSHISGFFKRLRYYLSKNSGKLKYYSCGEYGSLRGRPHYHAIIFSDSPIEKRHITTCWKFGYIDFQQNIQNQAIKYVTAYVRKKLGSVAEQIKALGGRVPAFARQSLGLGKSIIDKINHFTTSVVFDGKKEHLGRYLTNKLVEKLGIPKPQYTLTNLVSLADKWFSVFSEYEDKDVEFAYSHLPLVKRAYQSHITQFKRDFLVRNNLFRRKENAEV